ncbi:hypothetical protein BDZ85DRAFT_129111 [Elsinoe ampelina]|uniref:DUF676 domain-containing protein n=1 Tax=Elsinoe ampelina TaxID=302913 RepID=A0A6A6GAF7_9PEZI|nr:hypothetical protein BDZ85DRAFT_129111 [Elsinoe ampelina]
MAAIGLPSLSPYYAEHTDTFTQHFDTPLVKQLPSPLTLFWDDVYNIIKNSDLVTKVLSPFFTTDKDDELYLLPPTGVSMWWWSFFSLLQLIPLFIVVIFSVMAISLLQVLTNLHDLLFWSPIQGPTLQIHPPSPLPTHNPRHRWVYINGIATGARGLHQNLEVLSARFNAPVLGIHNRTYGFLGDIIECVLQRSFAFKTLETRLAVPILKKYLLQPRDQVEKVILIAHSQGGICASMLIDQLFSEVSWDLIHDRLEVYTFGSAASHFRNPWYDFGKKQRLLTHLEHYCHEQDMVTSFGALSALRAPGDPHKGKVFVWKGKGGHLLNQHYLKGMFDPEVSFAKDGFLEGKIVPYLDVEGEGKKNGGRWYVLPGTRVGEGDKKVREVSHLWKYMVPFSAEENGGKKVDEGVAVDGVNGWKKAVQK